MYMCDDLSNSRAYCGLQSLQRGKIRYSASLFSCHLDLKFNVRYLSLSRKANTDTSDELQTNDNQRDAFRIGSSRVIGSL